MFCSTIASSLIRRQVHRGEANTVMKCHRRCRTASPPHSHLSRPSSRAQSVKHGGSLEIRVKDGTKEEEQEICWKLENTAWLVVGPARGVRSVVMSAPRSTVTFFIAASAVRPSLLFASSLARRGLDGEGQSGKALAFQLNAERPLLTFALWIVCCMQKCKNSGRSVRAPSYCSHRRQ